MNVEKELSVTRKKMFRMMTMNGIADLSLGASFLALGAQIFFDQSYFIFILVLNVPITMYLKKNIVFPRTGYYKFQSEAKNLDINPLYTYSLIAFLFILSALGAMKAFGMNLPGVLEDNFLFLIGLIFVLPMFWSAIYTGISRLFLYAAVAMALFIHGGISEYSTSYGKTLIREAIGLHLIVFGSVAFLFGVVLLIRFLTKYPVMEDSENEI